MEIKAVLFDMDGVVTDTETQYDLFFKSFIDEFKLPSDFVDQIKGVRWSETLSSFFSDLSENEKKELTDRVAYFEMNDLKYPTISGVINFIQKLKEQEKKIALVTSSSKLKTGIALKKMGLENVFDVEVTGNDIEKGKPAPDCYLLAAKLIGCTPKECVVFEDSFAGIEAGIAAGMKVIALSTTNTEDSLKGKTDIIIPHFKNQNINDLLN